MKGCGFINDTINKLPFEIHIPSYNYCGPGTKLQKRLNLGDSGINYLDEACKQHDIEYSKTSDINKRNVTDKILSKKAWERVKAKDSSIGEKTAAFAVANIMKVKSKLGMGLRKEMKKPSITLNIKAAKKSMKVERKNGNLVLKSALLGAKHIVKKSGGKKISRFLESYLYPKK